MIDPQGNSNLQAYRVFIIKHDIFPIQSAKLEREAKRSQSKEEAFQKAFFQQRDAAKPVLLM